MHKLSLLIAASALVLAPVGAALATDATKPGRSAGAAAGSTLPHSKAEADAIGQGKLDPTGIATGSNLSEADLEQLRRARAVLTGNSGMLTGAEQEHLRLYERDKAIAVAKPQDTAAQRATRAEAIAKANAMLERMANKPVSPSVVAQVDSILGIDSRL